MSHHITLDIAYKIGEAQRQINLSIDKRVNAEMNHISSSFNIELNSQLNNIVENPFNVYVKIPVKDDASENPILQKIFSRKLAEQYSRMFQHVIQITDGYYYILLQSPHFTCDDVRPRPVQKLNIEASVNDSSYVFSDSERKKFELRAAHSASVTELGGSSEENRYVIDKNNKIILSGRPTPRLGFDSEKKNLPTSLLLQRRPSRMSLPSISARGKREAPAEQPETSLTENEKSFAAPEESITD